LSNEQVGEFFNQNFICTYQKVGNFKLVNGQKQGGNVASYFCLPDRSVLQGTAGPIDAAALLREARWVKETRNRGNLDTGSDPRKFMTFMRYAHVERLLKDSQVSLDPRQVPNTMTLEKFADAYLDRAHPAQRGGQIALDNKGKIHAMMAVYPLIKLENIYKVVWEKVLNEKVSTDPVEEIDTANQQQIKAAIRGKR